jgi:hypothetical protein
MSDEQPNLTPDELKQLADGLDDVAHGRTKSIEQIRAELTNAHARGDMGALHDSGNSTVKSYRHDLSQSPLVAAPPANDAGTLPDLVLITKLDAISRHLNVNIPTSPDVATAIVAAEKAVEWARFHIEERGKQNDELRQRVAKLESEAVVKGLAAEQRADSQPTSADARELVRQIVDKICDYPRETQGYEYAVSVILPLLESYALSREQAAWAQAIERVCEVVQRMAQDIHDENADASDIEEKIRRLQPDPNWLRDHDAKIREEEEIKRGVVREAGARSK